MPSAMFGHAASRWGSQQSENLATSALVYLLNTYSHAGQRFIDAVKSLIDDATEFEPDLRFVEQLYASGGRIDAAGIGPGGIRRILIECKFGAVLDDGQIDGYLAELTSSGVLLFIVPRQRRVETISQVTKVLGTDLTGFEERGNVSVARVRRGLDQPAGAVRMSGQVVAITDWVSVLGILDNAPTDVEFVAELAQLQSYVDLMTGDHFVALAPEELDGRIGARWWQFTQLFDEAFTAAAARGILKHEGNLAASHGWSGRAVRIGPWLAWAGLWARPWADTANTPLWLDFTDGPGRPERHVALRALQTLDPLDSIRVFEREERVVVPLFLRHGAERADVVADLVLQLDQIKSAIETFMAANPELADDSRSEG